MGQESASFLDLRLLLPVGQIFLSQPCFQVFSLFIPSSLLTPLFSSHLRFAVVHRSSLTLSFGPAAVSLFGLVEGAFRFQGFSFAVFGHPFASVSFAHLYMFGFIRLLGCASAYQAPGVCFMLSPRFRLQCFSPPCPLSSPPSPFAVHSVLRMSDI